MTKAEQIRQAKRRGDVRLLAEAEATWVEPDRGLVPDDADVQEILEGKAITNVLRDPDHPTSAKIVEGTAG